MLPLKLPDSIHISSVRLGLLTKGVRRSQYRSNTIKGYSNNKESLKGMKGFLSPSPPIRAASDICKVQKPPWEQILSRRTYKKASSRVTAGALCNFAGFEPTLVGCKISQIMVTLSERDKTSGFVFSFIWMTWSYSQRTALNYKAHLKWNPVSISQLVRHLDWMSAISCAKCGKVKNWEHMQLFDATENWELKFPGACKVRNCNNFSREAPEKSSKSSWSLAKNQASSEDSTPHWISAERVQFSGQMWALGQFLPLLLRNLRAMQPWLLCFCYFILIRQWYLPNKGLTRIN